MLRTFLLSACLALALPPSGSAAEPIKLKLAFHTSDRSNIYHAAAKPFVDAVNTEAKGLLEIEVYFSGALGRTPVLQWEALRDGAADIAFVIPGLTPGPFKDTAIFELPGLFRNMREATLVFNRLIAANAMKDYRDFFVVGAFANEPESIHTRPPVASLDDLRGKRIRVNNPTLAATLAKLGMSGDMMPINATAEAISSGKIDGAAVPVSPLFEYGIGRVATYHYLISLSSAQFAVLMNRRTFDSLPKPARDVIRKYSGQWTAERFVATFEAINSPLLERLKSEPKRKVIFPSQPDLARAAVAFRAIVDEKIAESENNRRLLDLVHAEIAKLRSPK